MVANIGRAWKMPVVCGVQSWQDGLCAYFSCAAVGRGTPSPMVLWWLSCGVVKSLIERDAIFLGRILPTRGTSTWSICGMGTIFVEGYMHQSIVFYRHYSFAGTMGIVTTEIYNPI
mmetsp:Transcript_67370/g.137167  ORF Transcript_67370/g.137167 Transcript_67370/m.137167 type:complete len:116 (+) Transcript_67370:782-1129(+)